MRAKAKLSIALTFVTAFYLSTLWQGHLSASRAIKEEEAPSSRSNANQHEKKQTVRSSLSTFQDKTHVQRILPVPGDIQATLNPIVDDDSGNSTGNVEFPGGQRKYGLRIDRGEYFFRENPGDDRPPFDTVVDEYGNVTGNVEDLLHFAVIGFGKCGTTSMISWLDAHPELQTYPKEIYDMMFGRVGEMVRKIYSMPVGKFKRGYKSPADLAAVKAVEMIRRYFPKTKLIVGIRHPVRWFESLYNFRVQNLNRGKDHSAFPRPLDLIGRCNKGTKNTCTFKGEFGLHLRNLGKTLATHNHLGPLTRMYKLTKLESRMYAAARVVKTKIANIQEPVPNPVFLFEMNQLSDENEVRNSQFGQDIQEFLELDSPLPPMIHNIKPGKSWESELQSVKDSMKIDICDDEHTSLRMELMRMARLSSVWIRKYLLDPETMASSGVHVSSPDYFNALLEDWMIDPCGEEATRNAGRLILEAS
jgi:hypothetical protein